jgi:hypothetical protein
MNDVAGRKKDIVLSLLMANAKASFLVSLDSRGHPEAFIIHSEAPVL